MRLVAIVLRDCCATYVRCRQSSLQSPPHHPPALRFQMLRALTACQEFSARLPLSAPGRLHCRSPRSACSAGLMRMGQVDGTGPQTWHRFPSHHGSRWKLGTYFASAHRTTRLLSASARTTPRPPTRRL